MEQKMQDLSNAIGQKPGGDGGVSTKLSKPAKLP